MKYASHSGALLAALSLSAAFLACPALAAPLHRVQYEAYNDQQTAPRDGQPASDLQVVANQQTPSELQSQGNPQSDQPSDSQPSSSEQKSEQAIAPQSPPEQPNAFVSGKSSEPQDVAQTEPQSSAQSKAQDEPEQKSSESQTQQAAPSTEPKSGDDDEPGNP